MQSATLHHRTKLQFKLCIQEENGYLKKTDILNRMGDLFLIKWGQHLDWISCNIDLHIKNVAEED